MNRHQSNPFLNDLTSQLDEQTAGNEPIGSIGRRHSSTSNEQKNGANPDRRLYHRNMSSFEAASWLVGPEQVTDEGLDQTDLIAKMTADFQSAIETSDKEFADLADGEIIPPGMNPFDPFETIVDDDVSIPSPAFDNFNNVQNCNNGNQFGLEGDEEKKTENLEDYKEDEMGSGCITSKQTFEEPTSENVNETDGAFVFNSTLEQDCGDLDRKDTNGTGQQDANMQEEERQEDLDLQEAAKLPSEQEAEIEQQQHQEQQIELEKPSEFIKRERPSATIRPPAMLDQQQDVNRVPRVTPKNKPSKQKKRSSFQEDSSDSSEDDDRIQIVIKAKESNQKIEDTERPIVPLLPPPPSKSSLKQARERGQVEDIPSPVMSYKMRQKKKDSFEDDEEDDEIEEAKREEASKSMADPSGDGVKRDGEEKEELKQVDSGRDENEEDHDEDESNNRFVIPMNCSDDDEDGDKYGKPDTPLYDEDTSYVLEDFPAKYEGPGWEMMLRYPPKKKLTSNRFWKKIFVKIAQVPFVSEGKSTTKATTTQQQQTCIALQIYDKQDDKKPMQEIPIQPTYTVSEISSQQFDQFGKIFTIKLQYIFYKERVGVRQGQLARFIHSGHIGSSTTSGGHGVDPISIGAIKRMGAPIEHSPQISQIIKLGCTSYDEIRQFKNCLEDHLFKMSIHRDRALTTYKTEEVQMAVRDETYLELNQVGTVVRQLARVRLFFLSFLNGMPTVEVGINDIHRQGREVVGRMDILPVVTEEWIRLEAWELHSTVERAEFENVESRIVKLVPPDATFFELMRFRVRPPRNRELPLQISANMSVTRTKVSINCEVMVPGCVSRKHGQIPCEDIAIRIHIPECWIYFFREEKHFRMGSKKSVNRRPGKVKGIERLLGGGGGLQDINDESSLIEVTSGQAKYEHHHHAIVWRATRWPKESQSAYVQNTMKIRLPLTAYDKMPENFYDYVHVEYTMPATTVSHTTLRSISVNPCDEEPAEKYVKYSSKYEYKVKMRLAVNLSGQKGGNLEQEPSPIVIMKQPDLKGDLQREEDSDDNSDDVVDSDN